MIAGVPPGGEQQDHEDGRDDPPDAPSLTGDPALCTDLYDLPDNQRTGWQILSGPGNPMITVFDPYQNGVTYSLDLRTVPPCR